MPGSFDRKSRDRSCGLVVELQPVDINIIFSPDGWPPGVSRRARDQGRSLSMAGAIRRVTQGTFGSVVSELIAPRISYSSLPSEVAIRLTSDRMKFLINAMSERDSENFEIDEESSPRPKTAPTTTAAGARRQTRRSKARRQGGLEQLEEVLADRKLEKDLRNSFHDE